MKYLTKRDVINDWKGALKENPFNLENIDNQTEEMCMMAVKGHGGCLCYVKNKTEQICIEAVKNYGFAIQYIENPTLEICVIAVKNTSGAIRAIKKRNATLCCELIKKMKDSENLYNIMTYFSDRTKNSKTVRKTLLEAKMKTI